ncbi:MAG: MopE-related protein [Myxococcota bacterium]|nr:MopE-related protein [Myxococcota bacterium]
MTRATLGTFLLATLAGCSCQGRRALLARVEVTPQLQATCVQLEVASSGGKLLQTVRVERGDEPSLRIAVFQGELPEQVRIRARALLGAACGDPLAASTLSNEQPAEFKSGEVPEVVLTLELPGVEVDVDRDGFVATEFGGPDCDDADPYAHPGAVEVCAGGLDNNCDGKRGCADPLCAASSCSNPAARVVITSAPLVLTAGVCSSAPLTLQVQDGAGALAVFPQDTALGWNVEPAVELSFHSRPDCTDAPGDSLVLAQGSSDLGVYLRATRPASLGQLTIVPPAGLTGDSTGVTLRPGPLSSASHSPSPLAATAGLCSPPVTLSFFDAFDNPAPFTSATDLALTASPEKGITLFGAASCAGPEALLTVPAGAALATLSFRGTVVGPLTVTANVPGLGAVDLPANLTGRLAPVTAAQTLLAGACSAPLQIQAQDAAGAPLTVEAAIPLALTSTPLGLTFFSDPGCTQAITQSQVPAGQGQATIHARAITGAAYLVEVNAGQPNATSQPLTVRATVRTGACTLASGAQSGSCPVDPPLFDRNKALMVFQATGAQDTPASVSVACTLASVNAISCQRVGTTGSVAIRWHTVERPAGLQVQHLTQTCVSSLVTQIPITPVASMASTFLLASQSRPGTGEYDSNDLRTVVLTANNQVTVTTDNVFCDGGVFELQVVEWAGASVTRGTANGLASYVANRTITGLSAVDESRTLLLYSHRSAAAGTDICEVMVRGELAGPTSVYFSRGNTGSQYCTDEVIAELAWERVELPAGNGVQELTTNFPLGDTAKETPITPVDLTRSLAFSGAQWHGGQGGGEGDQWDFDLLGEMTARHSLPFPAVLRLERGSALDDARFTSYVLQVQP